MTDRTPPELSTLPEELLLAIGTHLEPQDVAKLARTSKLFGNIIRDGYLWQLLAVKRFGKEKAAEYKSTIDEELGDVSEDEKEAAWAIVYRDLSELWIPASDMDIAHMDGHYWKLVSAPDAYSDQVPHLHSVCWFDVSGLFPSVPTGRAYRVVFRLALGFNAPVGSLDGMKLSAKVLHDHSHLDDDGLPDPNRAELPETSTTWTPQIIQRLKAPAPRSRIYGQSEPVPVWRSVALPPLYVPPHDGEGRTRRYAPVRVEMVSHSGHWKSNVWVDGVEIVPIGGPSEREAEAAAVELEASGSEPGPSTATMASSSRSGRMRPPPYEGVQGEGEGGWLEAGMRFFRRFI